MSPRHLSPNIRYGGVTTLAQNTSSFQEVSPPRQRHLVLMRCYLLTIQVENETIAVRSLLYIHNSKNTKLQLWVGFVSTFWSASDTESKKPKSQLWMQVVSTFWSASDTESQKPKSQHYIWWCHHLNTEHMQFLGGVSPRQRQLVLMRCYLLTIQDGNERIAVRSRLYIHNSKKTKFQLWVGGCLHLLISKWHWVPKS